MPKDDRLRQVGELLPPLRLETLAHGYLSLPGIGLTHLQFRRFSGCPVCNVQLRRFARAHAELSAAGVQTVSFFYSPKEKMLDYQYEIAHPIVADPTHVLFDLFGVERSRWAALHPRAWFTAAGGMLTGPTNPFEGAAQDGLPADFLIMRSASQENDDRCKILALHYGTHVDDQWSVEEVLRLAKVHGEPSTEREQHADPKPTDQKPAKT